MTTRRALLSLILTGGATLHLASGAAGRFLAYPAKLEMVFKMGTTKALGLTIPATVRLRADRVIEW